MTQGNAGAAIRCVALAGSCWMAIAAPALAQQAIGEAAESPDSDIIVTGSRVRVEAPVGSGITSIGQADIVNTPRVTLDRIIKELPQVFDLGVSENSRGQSGGSGNIVYGNSINLHGIGANATLILVDGHRVVNNGRSTDPSVLPTLGVERIEVVADGASAIYGSDAVAGVVNLIPRRSLDGVEGFARGGISGPGDYHELSAGVAFGKKFDRGQVMIAYEHVEKSNLSGSDRSFFTSDQRASGGADYRTTRCAPGTITAGGVNYAIPASGVTQATAGQLVPGTTNLCDVTPGQDLIPRQRYDSVNGTFTFELTDWMTFFADGFYSMRHFERNPTYANAALTVPQTNAFFVRPTGFTGTSYTLAYSFKNDWGRDTSVGTAESWQVTPGLRFKLPHEWEFEALLGKGRTSDNSESRHAVNNAALNASLASSNPVTAFDPYGLGRTSQSVLDGIFNQIFLAPTIGHFTGYEARLNGPLFKLPGGKVQLALGYEGQDFTIDLGSARGAPTTQIAWRSFSRKVDSFYGEVFVPIFGDDNATTLFQSLVLDAAIRYDKYSDVGSTTNPKLGINWTPVEGVKLRASYGTSFRAPTLPQIYGNSDQLFVQNYLNPAGGSPIVGVARSGGNLGLKPETATTWSVGADFEPADGLRLSATFFSVDYENQVVALLSDLAVLTRASQYDGTGLIVQGPQAGVIVAGLLASGLPISGALPGGNPLNVTVYVDGRSQNLAQSLTQGIDFSANYRLPTDRAGDFTFNVSGTYITKFNTAQTPTAPVISQLNQIFQPLKLRLRAQMMWEKGPFTAMVRATHVGGYDNNTVTPIQRVSSYTPVDLNLMVRVGEDNPFQFGLEIRNMFNVEPPYVNIAPTGNGSGGYDATAADPIGRFFAISVRKSF